MGEFCFLADFKKKNAVFMVTLNKKSKEKKDGTTTAAQKGKLNPVATIALWVLTVFMFASAIVFIPSAASVTMLLFSAIAAPNKRMQEFLQSKGLSGPLKVILLLVLFALSVYLAPTKR